MRYVLVPAVAARLFVDRDPGVGAASTFDLLARPPPLTSYCRCRGIVQGSDTHGATHCPFRISSAFSRCFCAAARVSSRAVRTTLFFAAGLSVLSIVSMT